MSSITSYFIASSVSVLSDGCPRSAGWREHTGPGESRRRKFDFDFRESDGHGGGGGRRRAGSEGLEDDRDGLPEWCTDEEDGEMGTFDSSGAFMPLRVCLLFVYLFVKKKRVYLVFWSVPYIILLPALIDVYEYLLHFHFLCISCFLFF